MTQILDAMDEMNRARDLVRLIAMTARENPGDDQNALAGGCEAIEAKFEVAFELLEQAKEAAV